VKEDFFHAASAAKTGSFSRKQHGQPDLESIMA